MTKPLSRSRKAMSPPAAPWRRESAAMIGLAMPLALTQIAYMAIVATDVVMMGWLGSEALAAGSLAGHLFAFFEYFAIGLLGAVAPILSQHLGARRFRMIRRGLRQGFWAAALVALPATAAIWQAETILVALGQEPSLATAAQSYLRYMVWGFLPGLWLFVLSELLAAHTRPRAALIITLFGIALNAMANYALMFGNFGFPKLGLDGAGIASAAVSGFMFLGLLAFVATDRRLRRYRLFGHFWRADPHQLIEILRLGLPIAVTALAEIGMFLASSLLMGLIGTTALAAHAIAVQGCALVYMVPLGIAQAATVRVGRASGAGDASAARRAGWTGIALAGSFAILPALAFWFFGGVIAGFYLDPGLAENRATIEVAVSLLLVAALFQVVDATQVSAMGALRGLKDTRGPMLIAVVGYWGLGLPMAGFLGVVMDFGAQAVWASMAVGLFVVGLLLLFRFQRLSRRPTDLPAAAELPLQPAQ